MSTSDPGHVVRACLDAYAADPHLMGKKLRYLIDHTPEVFDHVALTLISSGNDSSAVRYTIALLAARGRLTRIIRRVASQDPGSAGMLARIANKVDARIDFSNGAAAEDQLAAPGGAGVDSSLLFILSEVLRGGLDLFSWLAGGGSLDAHSRSRLARVAGRGLALHSLLIGLLDDPDSRVRANAVESLWNVPGSLSIELLRRASADPHHRVSANALVGLYLAGEISALGSLIAMTSHSSPMFQAAAVWAMGRTGDERFETVLRSVRAGGRAPAALLRNVLPAMARIQHSRQARETRGIGIRVLAASARAGSVDYVISTESKRIGMEENLKPVEFHPYHLDKPVWDYRVSCVESPGGIHISWLIPATTVEPSRRETLNAELLGAALGAKRGEDTWSVSGYRESRPSHFANDYGEVAQTGGGLKCALAGGLRRPRVLQDAGAVLDEASALDPKGLPLNVCAAAAAAAQPLEARERPVHVIIVADLIQTEAVDPEDLRTLAGILTENEVVCHVIASSRARDTVVAGLAGLPALTGGWVVKGEVDSSAAQAAAVCAAIRRHWRLTLPATAVQVGMSLRIVSGTWRGETILPEVLVQTSEASAA